MRLFALFPESSWVELLGSALLQFVWQGFAIGAVYAAARRLARTSSSEVRYVMSCAALAAMACAPVVTMLVEHTTERAGVVGSFAAPVSSPESPSVRDVPATAQLEVVNAAGASVLPWVVLVWFTGAVCFGLRLTGSWIWAMRLCGGGVRPAPPEWQQRLKGLKTRIRLARGVRLMISPAVQAPAVLGWIRPMVLVPAGALAGLPAEQLEAVLLHELAHIRRHDYLVNLAQGAIESLLFYHPAVWWISAQIREEREHCCDDVAVALTGDAIAYARTLTEFAGAQAAFRPALGANGGSLARRVARLLGVARPAQRTGSGGGAVAAAVLLGVAGMVLYGQSSDRPQFEAASVKPSSVQNLMMVRPQPGRLTATANLRLLMQNAYTVQPFQILGAPNWVDSDRFEIDAKAGERASRAQIFLMLQSLLEDRFELRVHRETREFPGFALVPARGGLKLPRPKEGACEAPPPDAPLDWAGGRMQPPGAGAPALPRCGSVAVRLAPSGAQFDGGKVRMPELTRVLAMVMGRPVADKTGYSEEFDVHLAFLPDQSTALLPPPPPDSAAAQDPKYGSILTSLQEQLGLRLESSRNPVDVLVVDHVQKPSAN